MAGIELQLLSRSRCHLCEEMEIVLRQVLPEVGLSYTVHDVDSNPEWRRLYGDVVPVLLRNGSPVAKYRIGRRQLLRVVQRTRRPSSLPE